MGGSVGGPPKPANENSPPASRPTADELREQQAIAAAMLVGEQLRREDRKQVYWLAFRLGTFAALMSVLGLLILFAYSRMREDFSPTFWMLVIGAAGAAGVVTAFWAYAEDRRE